MTLTIYYAIAIGVYVVFSELLEHHLKQRIKALEEIIEIKNQSIKTQARTIEIEEKRAEDWKASSRSYKALAEGKPFIIHINGRDFSNN